MHARIRAYLHERAHALSLCTYEALSCLQTYVFMYALYGHIHVDIHIHEHDLILAHIYM